MSMGTMPRTPPRLGPTRQQPMAGPGVQPMSRSTVQPVTGGRTTLAQRQAMTPFRNYSKPTLAKVDPRAMQQQVTPPQATTFPEFPNVGLPDFGGVDNSSFQPMPDYGNNGQPGLFNGNVVDNSSFTPYNGQFDLSGMTGQQQAINAQTGFFNQNQPGQMGSSSGGKSMGPSSSGYGGGKTTR